MLYIEWGSEMIRPSSGSVHKVGRAVALIGLTWVGCAVAQVGPPRFYFDNGSSFTWDQTSNQISFSNLFNNSGRDVTDIHIELLNGLDTSVINQDLPFRTGAGQYVVAPGTGEHWSFARSITTQSAYSIKSAYWTPTVPEPASWTLLCIGVAGLGLGIVFRRQRAKNSSIGLQLA